jgi:mono/diheme cytochrome c family protein
MTSWPSATFSSVIDAVDENGPARAGAGMDSSTAEPESPGHAGQPAASALPALLGLGGMVFLFAAGALLLRQGTSPAQFRIAAPASHAEREAGFGLYRAHCASCHGDFLGGAPGWQTNARLAPALNDRGHAQNHSDAELFLRVSAGARSGGAVTMPAFRGALSDSEILSVLAYVQSWWPPEVMQQRAGADWTFPAECTPAEAGSPSPMKAIP